MSDNAGDTPTNEEGTEGSPSNPPTDGSAATGNEGTPSNPPRASNPPDDADEKPARASNPPDEKPAEDEPARASNPPAEPAAEPDAAATPEGGTPVDDGQGDAPVNP